MRWASSGGRGVPALGGREDRRNARTNRPASRLASMSEIHSRCSSSTRRVRPAVSSSRSARAVSSLAPPSAATTTERRSRRSSSSRSALAASARSIHSAERSLGRSRSAMATTWSRGISGRFSFLAASFCLRTSSRTAGIPPLSTCSATGRCSAGTSASAASRWVRRGRSRLGVGRWGTGSGRGPEDRSRRFPRPSPRPPSPLPSLRPPPRRLRSPLPPRPLGASWVVTSGSSRPDPRISRVWASLRGALSGSTEVISIPSTMNSASTRSTEPTAAPSGRSEPSMSPLGCLAPAARQVQDPSGRALVSSISRRRDIGASRYSGGALCPKARAGGLSRVHPTARSPTAPGAPDGTRSVRARTARR